MHKIDYITVIHMLQQLLLLGRCWMLVARCLIICMLSGVESINIQYRVKDPGSFSTGETSIKDQSMTAKFFVHILIDSLNRINSKTSRTAYLLRFNHIVDTIRFPQ